MEHRQPLFWRNRHFLLPRDSRITNQSAIANRHQLTSAHPPVCRRNPPAITRLQPFVGSAAIDGSTRSTKAFGSTAHIAGLLGVALLACLRCLTTMRWPFSSTLGRGDN
ncbi:hypothetical protein CRG98_036285 [Punica granatum]|uniref:Uncharacterized protein n=1 Tax=Punica granatum TaxID=22663 RepID=A0A2I0IH25_PUNGR|nr:hypothetical protein CRG98_036285 [Punica granatum]